MFDPAAIQAAPPPERGPNVLSLLAQIWVQPRRALAAIAIGPAWLWLIPVILALALSVGHSLAAAPGATARQRVQNEAMIAAQIESVPEEYRDTLPEEMTAVPEPSQVLVLWVPMASAVAGILLGWLVRAAVLHVSSLAMGGRQSYGSIYRTAAWASFPLLLRDLVQTIYLAATGSVIQGAGLSGLLTAAPSALPGAATGAASAVVKVAATPVAAAGTAPLTIPALVLGRIDLFTLWYVVLLGLAVLAAAQLGRGKTARVVIIYVVLSLAVSLSQLVTQGLFGGA